MVYSVMLFVVISSLLLLLDRFLKHESLRFRPSFPELFFVFGFTSCSYIVQSESNFLFYVILTPLLFAILGDLKRKEVFILPILLSSIGLLWLHHAMNEILPAVIVTIVFFAFSYFTNETYLGFGDVWFLFPLLLITPLTFYPLFFIFACFSGIPHALLMKRSAIPFTPHLFVSSLLLFVLF